MASIAFRHVAILLEGHCVQVYYFSENSSDNACLELIYTEGDVTWIQLFNDTESVFISGQQLNAIQHQTRILQQKQKTVSLENALDVMELQDDLDMDFYGEDEDENKEEKEQKKIDLEFEKEQLEMNETNAAFPSAIPTSVSSPSSHSKETSPPIPGETKNGSENAFTFDTFPPISSNSLLPSTMILMTLKSSNTLQFTKLPSSPSIAPAVVFTCTNLISLSEVLHNSSEEIPLSDESITSIDQAHLVSLGSKVDDVYLLLVTSDANLIFYRAFHPDPPIHFSDTLAGVLFVRQHSNLQILMSTSNPLTGKQISVHPFKNIHHQPGLFVIRGREPSIWIMASRRSSLHAYSMDLGIVKNHKFPVHSKAHVTGFSPFHHPNCPFGFLLATSQGHLALSVLDELMNFDMELPYRTVPTYRTSHFASYQSETLTFALISSHVVDFKLIIEVPDQQEHNAPSGMKVPFISPEILEQRQLPEGAYPPQVRQFQVDLISTVNLAIADSYFFDEYEYVLAVVTVPLECKQAPSGKKPFLVVGTSFAKGEDVATRGKLYVFDVITVVPEPGKPETSHRLKLLAVEDVKAPVTALASFHGHLLVGTGAKIILYDFEDMERLIGVAFHDTHLFVNHVVTFKAFILAGDMYKSIMLFAWQEDPPKLILVSKDHHPLSTTALSLLIQGDLAGFLVGDDEGGLNLLLYSPYHIQSYGGMKLLRWGDLYLGSVVEKLIHYRMRPNSLISLPDPSFCCLYLCKDGSIGVVAPVSEVMYKRFLLMYNQLTSNLFPLASLHPKAFRRTLSQHRMYSNKQMTLLDLNIFNDFFQLSFADQKRHTAAVGTSLTRVQLDLKMLQNAWTVL
ncbi:Cleavage and polyadenylation specificity factor subunit 1 [Coelomomyces lativittatus]|nr:Cleavage and polyadenylation specificity factor subunit 1 [Coelomomyces lativittatus]KAJ1517637.1 Cleavage and polyadenylation specificity factor subunit 1 [Coelomomyces lativittatus]